MAKILTASLKMITLAKYKTRGASSGKGRTCQALSRVGRDNRVGVKIFSSGGPFNCMSSGKSCRNCSICFTRHLKGSLNIGVGCISARTTGHIRCLRAKGISIILTGFAIASRHTRGMSFTLPCVGMTLNMMSRRSHIVADLSRVKTSSRMVMVSKAATRACLRRGRPSVGLRGFSACTTTGATFRGKANIT